jgi:hypothetical protein
MEISERLNLDGLWSIAAAVTSGLLILSGSVADGLRLADQARRRADPINDTMASIAAWVGGTNYGLLGSPREAQDWFTSELAKPRTAHAAVRRLTPYERPRNHNIPLLLHDVLVTACIDAGELTKARAYLAEADSTHKPPKLLFLEGE